MENLTPFQQDLTKILLDKGLLLSVAALFVWYLNRLAEKYRAGHAYYGVLAQKRIEAYQTLAEHLGLQVRAVSRILFILDEERRKGSSTPEEVGEKLDAAYREFVSSHEQTKAPLVRHSMFLTKEVADAISACQAKIDELINALYDVPSGGRRLEEPFDLGQEVTERLSRVLERMTEQIHRYDYK